MPHSGISDILEGLPFTEPGHIHPRPSIARRRIQAVKLSQDAGEWGTEFGTEETPPADIAVTSQLYSSLDPLKLDTTVHHAHNNPTRQ